MISEKHFNDFVKFKDFKKRMPEVFRACQVTEENQAWCASMNQYVRIGMWLVITKDGVLATLSDSEFQACFEPVE